MNIKDDHRIKIYEVFKKRYPKIPSLLIFKTMDYSENLGKSFDNLEEFENSFPISYNFETNKWEPAILSESQLL